MTLPIVNGWLIDFRTAEFVFLSRSNERISHLVGQCAAGSLFFCHEEKKLFEDEPALKRSFVTDNDCLCEPIHDDFEQCANVQSCVASQPRLGKSKTPIWIAGIAVARNFGVIANPRPSKFQTVYGVCSAVGATVLTADEYFLGL